MALLVRTGGTAGSQPITVGVLKHPPLPPGEGWREAVAVGLPQLAEHAMDAEGITTIQALDSMKLLSEQPP